MQQPENNVNRSLILKSIEERKAAYYIHISRATIIVCLPCITLILWVIAVNLYRDWTASTVAVEVWEKPHHAAKVDKFLPDPVVPMFGLPNRFMIAPDTIPVCTELKNTYIWLRMATASPDDVLREIGKQTGFLFTYPADGLTSLPKMSCAGKNLSVHQWLTFILKDTGYVYECISGHVVIHKSEQKGYPVKPFIISV